MFPEGSKGFYWDYRGYRGYREYWGSYIAVIVAIVTVIITTKFTSIIVTTISANGGGQ